jgi:two-component system, OmpR family, sensor histidine kinase QseC
MPDKLNKINVHNQSKNSRRFEIFLLVLLLITVNLFYFFVILPSYKGSFSIIFLIIPELAIIYLIVRFLQSENLFEKERIQRISGVAQKIKNRSKQNALKPMRLLFIPKEIRPIVESMNHMLKTIHDQTKEEMDFVSSASHELRTPLAGIKLQTQIAQRAKDVEEKKQALEKVVTSINRAESLINQLLTLHRLEPEIMKEKFKKVDLVTVAEHEIAELVPDALRKKINIGIAYGSKGIILGNPEALSVLINNLIRNAINYAPDADGKVELSINQSGKKVILAVQDNGIPKEERENVLKRFYKIQKGNKGGTGLGLSIVKKISDLHEAKIEFQDPSDSTTGLVAIVEFKEYGI